MLEVAKCISATNCAKNRKCVSFTQQLQIQKSLDLKTTLGNQALFIQCVLASGKLHREGLGFQFRSCLEEANGLFLSARAAESIFSLKHLFSLIGGQQKGLKPTIRHFILVSV